MSVTPNFVPRDLKTINFLIVVNDGERAIRFYNSAFGAELVEKLVTPEGLIDYAELKIEDTIIMLKEDPASQGIKGVTLQIYTGDAEGLYEAALLAGAEPISPVEVKYFGDRAGKVRDPFGIEWIISTHMEDISPAELRHRFDDQFN